MVTLLCHEATSAQLALADSLLAVHPPRPWHPQLKTLKLGDGSIVIEREADPPDDAETNAEPPVFLQTALTSAGTCQCPDAQVRSNAATEAAVLVQANKQDIA